MLRDLPAQFDIALYAGDTPTLFFDVSAELAGAAVSFTAKTYSGANASGFAGARAVSTSTEGDDLELTPLTEGDYKTRISFKRFPEDLRAHAGKELRYDVQVIFPGGRIKTYAYGGLEIVSDVSDD